MLQRRQRHCAEASPRLFGTAEGRGNVWQLAVIALEQAVLDKKGSESASQEKLYRFAACNIVEETIARQYPNRVVDMNNEYMVVIIRTAEGADMAALSRLLSDARQTFEQYYRQRTFSAAISDAAADYRDLTRVYELTVQQLLYRLALGPEALITPDNVEGNAESIDFTIPAELEKKLADSIRTKDADAIQKHLERIFELIASIHYDYMTYAVIQVVLFVKQILREPAFSSYANSIELQNMNQKAIKAESLILIRGSELLTTAAGDELGYTATGLAAGTSYTFKVEAGDAAGNWSVDGPANAVSTSGGGGGTGPVTTPTSTPTPNADPNQIKAPVPTLDAAGQAATVVDGDTFAKAAAFANNIYVEVPSVDGANGYDVTLPAEAVAAENAARFIEIRTELGTVKIHSAMLQAAELQGAQQVTLSVTKSGADELSTEDRDRVGDKPVLDITLKVGGVVYPWNNPNAPVELFIPYSPSVAELANSEHIVVWFIDENGTVVPVPSGKYDADRGGVTFTTTHFSKYAVAYVTKTFGDIAKYGWARNAIEVMASKGVINGTSPTTFAPAADIKRADFMLLLVKALGLSASANADESFGDVNPDAYYAEALAIAKHHGIAQGVGGNRFNPDASITRQDMMVLIDRALVAAGKGLASGSESDLDKFADKEAVASYARQSVATLVNNEIVAGNGTSINPSGNATRAETAVLIYRIYKKQ